MDDGVIALLSKEELGKSYLQNLRRSRTLITT